MTKRIGSSTGGRRDHHADAHAGQAVRLRERAPDEHVGIRQRLVQKVLAHEVVIRLVHEHQRVAGFARDHARIASFGNRLAGRVVRVVDVDQPRVAA